MRFWALALIVVSMIAIAQPFVHPLVVTRKGMVVTCQPRAADIGVQILRGGGSAADAFIATTLAEYVTAFGYTSLSGPLNLLYYDAVTKKSYYLNSGNNKVTDPTGQFDVNHPIAGEKYVIGGAARGLEELFKHYKSGNFSFNDLAKPAAELAQTGFKISPLFAWTIALKAKDPQFANANQWKTIFLKNGNPLSAGDTLVQAQLANTLSHYGTEGADFLFKGQFAQDLVSTIQANGGKLTMQDLANYQANWADPLEATYRGFTVQSGSYKSKGGLELLLALKTLENFQNLGQKKHFSKDEKIFEKIVRTFLFTQFALLTQPVVPPLDNLASQLWSKVNDPTIPVPWTPAARGQHSCDTIVIDSAGDMVAGNHTINSSQWGDYGMMTDGVSLNTAYLVDAGNSAPGERAVDPLVPVFIFQNGKPWAAAGFFDGSLQAGALQVLLNLMDYGMKPNDALFAPRFGTPNGFSPLTMPLDQRYPASWVSDFAVKNIVFQQPMLNGAVNPSGYADTGDAMVIQVDPTTGLRYGSPSEVLSDSIAESE